MNNSVWINTASSNHNRCFICRRKTKSLRTVNRNSIVKAYINHKILIKHHARCCISHLDQHGLIKHEEFFFISTIPKLYSRQSSLMFDTLYQLTQRSGPFDKFKDIATLEEKHCFEITRWTKDEFISFSNYITSVNDTNGRTKEQLIALYRYWLRKGLDQCSLAMFMNNKSQQQISHYLTQIREAINRDFVPYFLGAKSRSREFFLSCNNVTTIELFSLEKDDLAIFVDATFTRLEKSANNQFQYNCWSQQKMDLLIKPFIVCCADGYIIDCYGAFQANQNDAKIFDYILRTDQDLLKILKPHKTFIFLDRGKLTLIYYRIF